MKTLLASLLLFPAIYFAQTTPELRPKLKIDSITIPKLDTKMLNGSLRYNPLQKQDSLQYSILSKKPSDSLYLSLVKKESNQEMIKILNSADKKRQVAKIQTPLEKVKK